VIGLRRRSRGAAATRCLQCTDLARFAAVYEVIDGLICNARFYAAD
jgi:hypothetical protein